MTTNSEEGTERTDEYIVKKVQREMMNTDSEEGRQEGTLSKHKKVLKTTTTKLQFIRTKHTHFGGNLLYSYKTTLKTDKQWKMMQNELES